LSKEDKVSPNNSSIELHVNMSNDLVQAAQGLSLAEKRVVSLCMSKIDSLRMDAGRFKIKISASEYAETYQLDMNTAYDQLIECGDLLYERSAYVIKKSPKGKLIETKHRWVSACTYHRGEGWIELGFAPEMTPHMVLLRNEFTSYKLKQASMLRSIYSWRLLEIISQFRKTGLYRTSVVDFCKKLEVPETYLSDFGQLKRRVIEPALKELRAKDHWEIEYKMIKNGGRKVTDLEFTFKRNAQQQLPL
jgi:plasmid replication initiation protein